MTRRAAPYAAASVLAALLLAPLLVAGPAYAARTVTISITATGPKPASTTAAVGDTVVFVNDDATFVHQVGSGSGPWTSKWESPPLPPGGRYQAPRLTKPGTYTYKGVNLDSFTGKVVVPAAASPAPRATTTAAPGPSKSPQATASPSPTGSAGAAGAPPLAGGLAAVGVPSASPIAGAPAPVVAPTLPGEQQPSTAPSGPTVAIGSGRLPEPPTNRGYGLPASLAAVAAAGVASLLVRVLLAHPAARRARHASGVRSVTVD